ncbi:MAG TPA: phosphoribosylanthranilate isomerase [Paracoccaceae bacterium]|nr:phosphoribosylanthranilate isomerase [Paracoccaceae bacterium]
MRVKICGLTRADDLRHAAGAGADYVGLVFYPRSPRNVSVEQAAELLKVVPKGVTPVALLVDADDALVDQVAALGVGMLQLHGSESPERVAAIRKRTGLPVMKVISIGGREDLAKISDYNAVADQLLLDARAPEGATRPGGNAVAFDWRLIAGRDWACPWILAGGLTPENIAEAVRLTGATQVDVSSGVEYAPGKKDPARVAAFVKAAREAAA